MLRRVMGELKRSFGIRQTIPDQLDELKLAFAEFLNVAAANGGALILFDALNQLEDRDGHNEFVVMLGGLGGFEMGRVF